MCSVPFNVACGTCANCKERHTEVCLRANEELGFCGAYGFNLGGWQGGQAESSAYPVRADFQLLKLPDKDQALEKIRDLTAAWRRRSERDRPSTSPVPDLSDVAPRPARASARSLVHHRCRQQQGKARTGEEGRL